MLQKAEILQRAEEKIYHITDEHVKGLLQSKLNEFQRKQSSTKKETLISFFHEVCEELQQNMDTEENVILEDQYDERDWDEQ